MTKMKGSFMVGVIFCDSIWSSFMFDTKVRDVVLRFYEKKKFRKKIGIYYGNKRVEQ